jgi:hypothetical protein
MIQGKIDFNSPGPSTVCCEENAISPRLSSFYFHILIVKLMLKITRKCDLRSSKLEFMERD